MATTLRRRVSLATALLVGAGSLTAIAAPAQATPPQCTDGAYVQWDYVADTPQECVTPGTSGSGRVTSMHVWNLTGAGGGGGNSDPYAHGGNSAEIVFDLSVPEGETLSLYVPRGGLATESDPDHSASGAGGGGSAAIVLDGVVLAEAGGGGGATNSIDGGGPNDPDRFIGDDGDDACSGQGGNQDVAGTGGKGGPVDAGSCPATGGAGYPIAGEAGGDQWTGDGGDGAPGTAGAGTITGTGGWGWSRGGDGGSGETSEAAGGAGGGGGYGDGGGGDADGAISGIAVGSGGGGGSRVRSSATGGTPTYDYSSTGGSESDGDDGQIAFTMVGPAVVTRASAPTGVTASTATTHSTVDANSGMPVSTITIEYSTDPDFATDVLSVPGDPASLPGEIGDKPVQASLTGLSAGTVYYYRIVASNGEMSTAGAIDSFQTPIAVTGIDPDNGPETGGTEVTITGTGFREGTTVTIGGVACTPVHIVSATSLTCDTGVHVPATVDVVVL
ncbi:MAG: IPT/TIG domain-containing protein [Candidatus Nanopelagicales bacterium]